jgi:DNA-binding CsgD family transcriptional regulator
VSSDYNGTEHVRHQEEACGMSAPELFNRAAESVAAHLLDLAPQAIVLGDATGVVLHANASARRMLTARDGLRLEHQRLVAEDDDAALALQEAWRAIADGPSPGTRLLQVARPSQLPAYQLLLCAVEFPGTEPGVCPRTVSVAMQVFDPAMDACFSVRRLCRIYGLTPAEASVAAAIARGASPEAIASAAGHKVGTTRSLLKRAMTKIGASRQNSLSARLWLGAAGPLAGFHA